MSQIGVRLDPEANDRALTGETLVSAAESPVKIFVIPTNEQLAIANDTYELASRRRPVAAK
jgi:acetate kinase